MAAVAENVPWVDPAGMVMDGETFAPAGDDPSVIVAPAFGAGAVRATLQMEPMDALIETGLHEKPFKLAAILTEPPVAIVAMGSPPVSAAIPLVSCRGEGLLGVEADKVSVREASAPFGITVSLRPHTKQVVAPGLLLHDNDILAAAGPDVQTADEKSVVE